jgi:phosphohistidine phosphatase
MKTLYLLRHTKSSRSDDTLEDHDRPLSKRGRRAAEAIAAHLARSGTVFDLVLSSNSLRTHETVQPIVARLKPRRVVFDRELYLAPGTALLDRLRRIEDSVGSVLLVAHNPGLHGLALTLAAPGSPAELPPLSGKFPTGALACFRFKGPWRRLAPEAATLVSYLVPTDLEVEKA